MDVLHRARVARNKKRKGKEAYSSLCYTSTAPLRELTCHMGSHSVTCHPAEVTFPPLPQPMKAGTRFSDPRRMQGWVDLVGLVTYQHGIPARRRSPIPVLTGLNVEQLRATNDATMHSAIYVVSCDWFCEYRAVDGFHEPVVLSFSLASWRVDDHIMSNCMQSTYGRPIARQRDSWTE